MINEKQRIFFNAYRQENIWKFERLIMGCTNELARTPSYSRKQELNKQLNFLVGEWQKLKDWNYFGEENDKAKPHYIH